MNLDSKGLALKEGEQKDRPQFSTSWIQDRFLAPDALAGLNDEAQAIFLGMINKGARPSELANLQSNRIVLEHEFPHSREFNQDLGSAKRDARKGPVVITDRGKPSHVLLSYEEYTRITAGRPGIVEALSLKGLSEVDFEPEKATITSDKNDLS